MARKVYLLTGNSDKVRSAEKAFQNTCVELEQLSEDYPEIQAESSLKIAKHTVKQAMKEYDKPVVREDHSLYLDSIPGFPGPYMSYFNDKIPAEKLLQLLENKQRTGYFEVATVLGIPNGEIKEYQFRVPIEISEEIRGDQRNWDRIMMIENSEETFAESNEESRLNTWNQNYRKIAEEIARET